MRGQPRLSIVVPFLMILLTVPTTIPRAYSQILPKIAVSPSITANTMILPGQTLTLAINLTNSPPINNFLVSVLTDINILNPVSITSGGFFSGGTSLTISNCVNSVGLGCRPFIDGAGVATYSEFLLGTNTTGSSSTLFTIKYNVTGLGASQIHILVGLLSVGLSTVPVTAMDGYFSNKYCAPSVFCRPPLVAFSVTANSILVTGRPIVFNAVFATDNPGATQGSGFVWRFGDGTGQTSPNMTTAHVYAHAGNFLVVLRVTDTEGATGFASTMIIVSLAVFLDLALASLFALPRGILVVGESAIIFVEVTNHSTQAENATVRVTVQNTTILTSRQFINMQALGGSEFFSLTWNTTGLGPGTYQVEASVDPIRNSTTGQIIENDTSNNFAEIDFQIVPLPQQPVFVRSKILFDHRLSISRNLYETWNATIENPNSNVSLYAQIFVSGSPEGLPPTFLGESFGSIILEPGEIRSGITAFSILIPSSYVGMRVQFTASIWWGLTRDIPLVSSSVRMGSFLVAP